MTRTDRLQGLSALARRVLACGVAIWVFTAVANAAPIKVWSINFNDPAEPNRWKHHPYSRDSDPRRGSRPEQIQWALMSRSASDPSRGKVLQFSANSKLSVETYFSIFRAFPSEFQPHSSSDLVLEWEWRMADTELSGAVGIALLRAEPDGSEPDACLGVDGHTKFTIGWPVLFDPPNRWIHHRLTLTSNQCPQNSPQPKRPIGVVLVFVSPVRQVVSLASLRVEEWPHKDLTADPVFGPHHAPPPDLPFEALPFDRLRRSTAGAMEDLDGDGLPEVLVLERRGYAHLYRNMGSELEEITESSGLAQPTMGTGAVFFDLDADGDRDLILTSEFDVPRFFENLGALRFRERHLLDDRHLSFWYNMTADDVDRDGDSDLLFVSPIPPGFLFLRHQEGWRFRVESFRGLRDLTQRGELNFSASFADIDDDGWPDLFLSREYLFRNSSGRLKLQPAPWKPVVHAQTEGGVWADLTGDGRLDLLILRDSTEIPKGSSRLFEGKEGGAFVEVTSESGFPPLESAEVALAEDFDNDGDLDIYLCQRDRPNYLLLNDGHGLFEDATDSSGFSATGGCDAAFAADLNGDGGLDITILRYGSPPVLFFNQLVRGRWLGLILEGKPDTEAIGARAQVLDAKSGAPISVQWVRRGQGFGSVGPSELHFGLGSRQFADVEVRFPSGRKRFLRAVKAGSTRLVIEDRGGMLDASRRWILETRFPFVRSFRRYLPKWRLLAPLIAGLAFVASLPLFSKSMRVLSLLLLVGGALVALLLGSIPGRGLGGSPPALWAVGAMAGILVPVGLIGLRRLARSLRERGGDSVLQREDLIRFTHDFRHAGIEKRALLSIHNRVVNLFHSGEPHLPFLSALRKLATDYPRATGAQLRTLVALSQAAFPGLSESARLEKSERRLEGLLGQLAHLEDEPEPLKAWRDQLLLALGAAEAALTTLLDRLDFLCSCDAAEVLREAYTTQSDWLRRAGVTLEVDQGQGPTRVLITREALLMILENLFTNSLSALEAKENGRIEIELRRTHQNVILRYRDNGSGIPAELADKIFLYGFSTRAGGKGYGLPRSREILGHFGGGMALEKDATEGAAFLITLLAVSEK